MKLTTGMKIRAEDFQPREGMGACYMEGIVTHLHGLIHCKTTKIVFDGVLQDLDGREEFATAYPGSMIFDWHTRLRIIDGDGFEYEVQQ